MAVNEAVQVVKILEQEGSLTAEQSKAAEASLLSGRGGYDVLVNGQVVDEEIYTKAVAQVLQVPYVSLKGVPIGREVLNVIPESTAREHSIVAYEQSAEALKVAMLDPGDRQIVEFIHKKVDQPVAVALASSASLKWALSQYRESLEAELQKILQQSSAGLDVSDDLSKIAEDLPVVRTVDLMLRHAILQGASDIHIEPLEEKVVIRFRVDGLLRDVLSLPKTFIAGLVARIKVLAHLKIDEHRLPQDGRFKIQADDYKVAFRVSVLPVYDGEKVVMRLLDESGKGLVLESLGMRAKALESFRRNIAKPHGMILVTGPTGSGKTTTLYAAMKELNVPEVNISTIEDPIEYRMPRINQTQVNPQIGLTFASGLRSLVRQDPDIIMVGEIRDEETAALAINAALTGHLVLSTLHTNSASGALPRLLDMKVEAFLIASTANLLLAQRLVRQLCKECRQKSKIEEKMLADIQKLVPLERLEEILHQEGLIPADKKLRDLDVYQPVGCSVCGDGFKGRLGIYEAIEMTEEIRASISEKTTSQDLENLARQQQKMVTMIEDGFIKVVQGETAVAEVLRVAKE